MTSPRVLLLLAGLALSSLAEAAARPPNILFIYLDDFGWRDAGWITGLTAAAAIVIGVLSRVLFGGMA